MNSPTGSEQMLSLAWALEVVAKFSRENAVQAVCELMGMERTDWARCVEDDTWFIGDSRWNTREKIENFGI